MIRTFEEKDLDRIMELWLFTNLSAHEFVKSEYWKNNFYAVKAMMPEAEIYVYEENEEIQGFIGVMDHYIAGIFVSEQYQSKGIGKKLLDYVKDKNNKLSLSVYEKNERAIHFYLREQFTFLKKQIDADTGEMEWEMNWRRRKL